MPLFIKNKSDDATITGAIDGVNDTFFVANPYTAGTLVVFLNGQEKQLEFTESNPATGEFTWVAGCEPKTGDTLQAHYFDTTADGVDTIARTPLLCEVRQEQVCAEVGRQAVECEVLQEQVCAEVGRQAVACEVRQQQVIAEVACGN